MRASARLLPAAALCGAGLLAGACATDDADASNGAADYLADQADVLADRIGDDQPCEAIDHAERLVTRTWATVSNGELSTSTAAHVEQVVSEVVDQLVCEEPDEQDLDAADEVEDTEDTEDADEQDGQDTAGDRGESEGTEASDPAPREGGSGTSDGGDTSTSGRGSDPPGQGNGRGGSGDAPGQNRGSPGRGGR